MNIGKSIRYFRRLQGMRQGELCVRAGISQTYMSQVENHSKNLTWKKLCKISDVINIPVPVILHFAQDRDGLSQRSQGAYDKLDPIMREIVGIILAEKLTI